MSESTWGKATAYVVVIALAGVTYYIAQTSIDSHRATLPVKAYLDCLQKFSSFDWNSASVPKPSSGEVCKDLTSRQTTGD
jgi:hypothetical protein